ncbi:MAG: hypothetical protein HZB21_00560, partial [Deltaproteobacteria bacterium]|nr:hypothetical protein [Deltaproteobacteria bacterium]
AGVQNTIVLMGLVNVAIGILIMALSPFAVKKLRYIFATASAATALTLILTLPANMPLTLHKRFLTHGEDIVFYREGAAATVMIAERTGKGLAASNKRLWINGNGATAVFYEGLQINRFQGVLPMVLHQNPRDVLVICFGSGTTFGTLSTFPVDRVDNVEIASAVIEGAPHFKRENRDVLNNPRSRINIDDGRSFLAASTRKFDVITEEPMHPSLAGVVNLYTKEYYELAKAHLKEGGIMSQWIPLYNLSIEDVRLMAKTFQSVFPHTSIWLANTDIFLIGSPAKISVDYKRLREKLNLPEVKRLLTDIDLEDPAEFLNTFVMNEDMVKAYVKGADVMSDDMPIVEFTGPRSLHVNTVSPNIAELLKYREPVWPFLVFSRDEGQDAARMTLETKFASGRHNLIGRAYYADNNIPKAAEYFKESLRIDPGSRNSLHYKRKLWFF